MMHRTKLQLLLACSVMMAAAAAATRQQARSLLTSKPVTSYQTALANSSCHGFLIVLGTQKGGTTALWEYISENAHPHLRVSKIKEYNFWDELHRKYSGCRVGDYLQLQVQNLAGSNAGTQQQDSNSQQLPICDALGSSWTIVPQQSSPLAKEKQPWSISSAARLLPSTDCRISKGGLQRLSSNSNADQSKGASTVGPAAPGLAAGVATARLLLQDGAVEADPDSSQSLLQDMGAVASPIRGAPAQLTLPAAQVPQPMYHADITPRYLFDPAVPPRVRSLLPEARIVAILRDPVTRAISNFNMWWQNQAMKPPAQRPQSSWADMLAGQVDGEITRLSACFASVSTAAVTQPDLANCLGLSHPYSSTYDEDLFSNRLLAQGLYADQLQRWFELFPAESFLIWVSEDFKNEGAAHMKDLVQWLGLDVQLLDPKLLDANTKMKNVHGRKYWGKADVEVIMRMQRFFHLHNQRLFHMLEAKGFGAVAARMRQLWAY